MDGEVSPVEYYFLPRELSGFFSFSILRRHTGIDRCEAGVELWRVLFGGGGGGGRRRGSGIFIFESSSQLKVSVCKWIHKYTNGFSVAGGCVGKLDLFIPTLCHCKWDKAA